MNVGRNLRNNFIRYLIAVIFVMFTAYLILAISPKRISGDFDVYYKASQHYLAKAPVYLSHDGIEEFKYLPIFALVFSPLVKFNEVSALYMWSLFNVFLFYFMFYFLYKLKQISFTNGRDLLIIIFLFALTGRYIFADIKLGQANILLCFLMLLTLYLEINKKCFWSAVVLAFSLMIKFFPLLFLFYFILTKRFKMVAYTIFAVGIFLLLPAIYTGWELNFKYLQEWYVLLKSSPAHLFYSVKNYSLLSFFSWLFIAREDMHRVIDYSLITTKLTPGVYDAWAGTCFLLFSSFFYDIFLVKRADIRTKYLDYSCLFVFGLLFNPLAYLNALVFLIIPYCFILRHLFYSETRKWRVIIMGGFIILSFILLIVDNKIFFKNDNIFYEVLECRPLMWIIVLAYLSLLLMKYWPADEKLAEDKG